MKTQTQNKTKYHLKLTCGTSKGRDTYGYTTVSLRDSMTNKRVGYCNGGGYDMKGTVFAEFIMREFPEDLKALDPSKFYGLSIFKNRIYLDGGCGFNCMVRILQEIGYRVECSHYAKKGDLQHFTLEFDQDLKNKNEEVRSV